jgi:hypothetical protein
MTCQEQVVASKTDTIESFPETEEVREEEEDDESPED